MRRPLAFRLAAVIALACAAGCTLVNSLDEVKPADDGSYKGSDRPDASIILVDAGPPPSVVDASDSGHPVGQAFSPLVVAADVEDDAGGLSPVLTVLDSATGHEVGKREAIWVSGIAHDGVRDLWYIFESTGYVVSGVSEGAKIHIRKLDTTTAAWTELSVYTTDYPAPLFYYDAIGVTNDRLSYVSQPTTDGSATFRLITVDTSDPTSPKASSEVPLLQQPKGVIATRGASGAGGNLTLLNVGSGTDCVTDDAGPGPTFTHCGVKLRHYQLTGTLPPTLTQQALVGSTSSFASVGYGSIICGGAPDDLLVLPGVGPTNGTQHVLSLDYLLSSNTTFDQTFAMSTGVGSPTLLRKLAVDQSRKIVFTVEGNNDTSVYATALSTNPVLQNTAKGALRHSGQSVYYDALSETVFAPFNQGESATFSPFKVVKGSDGSISLNVRGPGDWDAPADLRPNVLGIHQPAAENCQ
jgi:hypothetical protein